MDKRKRSQFYNEDCIEGCKKHIPDGAVDLIITGPDFEDIEVPAGGLTVADVWARRGELAGQMVTVRGKVTKYNAGIMGRNWIHLQDGSGSEVDGTHDLVVTTDAGIAAGNVITIKGIVALDQDFGAGYKYPLLVEEATIE